MNILDYFGKEPQVDLVMFGRGSNKLLVYLNITLCMPAWINFRNAKPVIITFKLVECDLGLKFMSAINICKTFLKCSYLTHPDFPPPCTHTHTSTYNYAQAHTLTHQFLQETFSVLAAFQWTQFSAVIHHIRTQQYYVIILIHNNIRRV